MKNKFGKASAALVLIIVIVAVAVIYVVYEQNGGTTSGNTLLSVRYYDKNQNPLFSIVNGQEGVGFVDISINIQNTGNTDLSCNIVSLSPTAFDSAISRTTKSLSVGASASWVSALIDVEPLETLSQPVTFSATVNCDGIVKSGAVNITIMPDAQGDFDVSVDYGDSPEPPQTGNVYFRTSDLLYSASTAIAYTGTCGNDLVAYGSVSSASSTAYTCDQELGGIFETKLVGVVPYPGGGFTGEGDGEATLYTCESRCSGCLCICEDDADGSGYKYRYYSPSDSDASKVSTSKDVIDSSRELTC